MTMLCAAEAAVLLQRAELFSAALDPPSSVTDADFDRSEGWVFGILAAFLLGQLVTGVLFIRWQHRLARSSWAASGQSGLGPAWAIGGWFVPVVNVVLAGIQLRQLSRSTSPPAPGVGRGSQLVVLWTVTFAVGNGILAAFAVRPASFSILELATPDDLRAARATMYLGVVANLVLAVAAVLGIAVVQRLTRQQSEWAAATGANPGVR